jgi:hypothetical protein
MLTSQVPSFEGVGQQLTIIAHLAFSLQLIAVPKARIGNLLFWDIFKEFPVSQ